MSSSWPARTASAPTRASISTTSPPSTRGSVEIGGPLCTAADILATGLPVERAEIGDLVVLGHSGAYGLSVAMVDFLSHPRAPEHFIQPHKGPS